jgi:hypothetical protein
MAYGQTVDVIMGEVIAKGQTTKDSRTRAVKME